MVNCMICGKKIKSGNICEKCFKNKDDDFNDYIPEYGDTYGVHKGAVLINAKSFLNESDTLTACSYLKGSYMQLNIEKIPLDFITAVKNALKLIETENLEEVYVYSSDFTAFKIRNSWREIEKCYVVRDITDCLGRLVISLWSKYDYVAPNEIIKENFEVSKLPPEKFFKYEDYLQKLQHR